MSDIPAFPRHYEILQREMIDGKVLKVLQSDKGMLLRDYFAGQALIGYVGKDKYLAVAEYCYRMADAMLKDREVKNGN